MKIIFIITGLGVGGAEKQVCDLADSLSDLGHVVTMIVLGGKIIFKPLSNNIQIINLDMKKNPLSFLWSYLKARRIVEKLSPDVIHSHMIHANIFTRLLRLTIKINRLICTAHNTNEGGKLRMFLYRITDGLCNLTTNVSYEAVNSFLKLKAVKFNKIRVMYNGINIENFQFSLKQRIDKRDQLGILDSDFLFLAVGRLTEQKDYPNLLLAFEKVFEKNCNAKLVIIGDGDLKIELISLINKNKAKNNIQLLGRIFDVVNYLSAADCYVLSSKYEGFGIAVVEAMANKKLIVATNCGGVREVLGDNVGRLVPIQSSSDLAEAMIHTMNISDGERIILGQRAFDRAVEKFSLINIVNQWISIYKG